MRRFAIPLLLALLPALHARADVKVTRVDYRGWPGCYRLSNGDAELVFVPQIGRVMRFARMGGPNVLWENPALAGKVVSATSRAKDWVNYGGDKLWPAPQNHWKWPPDTALDGSTHTVTILPGGKLRVVSPSSREKQIRYVREISLEPHGARAVFRNVMENTGDQDVDWSVWEVSQVRVPDYAELPLYNGGKNPSGHYTFKDYKPAVDALQRTPATVRFRWHPTRSGKIGTDSPAGWVRARLKDELFTVSAKFERGQDYPDDGCGQEIWSNPAPLRYMELELLGPIRKLQPGEKQDLVTRWSLEPVQRAKSR